MNLQTYLNEIKEGKPVSNVLEGVSEDIQDLLKYRFILSYLKLKEILETIHAQNKIEGITITLGLVYYDKGDYLNVDVFKKGSISDDYESEEDCEYGEDWDCECENFEEVVPKLGKIKTLKSDSDEEYRLIHKYKIKLSECCKHFNTSTAGATGSWFGSIIGNNKSIYLDQKTLPDIEEWLLGADTRPVLNRAIMEESLIKKDTVLKEPNKYKI